MMNSRMTFLLLTLQFIVTAFVPESIAQLEDGQWVRIVPQKPELNIETLITAPDGSLWASYPGAFHHLVDDVWTRYDQSSTGLTDHTVFAIGQDNTLYIIDGGDLVCWKNGAVKRYTAEIPDPVVGSFGPDGSLYMSSYSLDGGGVFVFDGETVERIASGRVRSVAVGPNGGVWMTLYNTESGKMSLQYNEGGEWIDRSEEVDSLYPVTTRELTVQRMPDGRLWVSNVGKYSIFSGDAWSYHDGGGAAVYVRLMSDGSIWGYGNNKFYLMEDNGDWKEMYVGTELSPHMPTSLAELSDGSPCFFDGRTIHYYDGKIIREYNSEKDLASSMVTTLAYSSENTLVVGHGRNELAPEFRLDKGISIRDENGWFSGRRIGNIYFVNVFHVEQMPDGDVMAFTDGSFKQLTNTTWTQIDSLYNFNNETDMGWYNNSMWITTTRGLVEFIEHPEYEFYFPLGESDVFTLRNLTVYDAGLLYMQVPDGDVVTFNGTDWETILNDDGLTNDFAVIDDRTIWGAREYELAYREDVDRNWNQIMELDKGRLIEIDDNERIWFSGYGVLGFYEDGVRYLVPEFEGFACDDIAFADDGRVAVNLFDREREEFYGILEYQLTSAVEKDDEQPKEIMLSKAFPNPFNPATTIAFNLPETSAVRCVVYSITGQKVADFGLQDFPGGWNRIVWTADDTLSSGLYFYRLTANESTASGKIMLLK